MARTKASVGAKVAAGKSSKARCSVAPVPSSSGTSGASSLRLASGGGNPVCPRETPKWQKPITNFFICKDGENKNVDVEEELEAGTSKSSPKKPTIQSGDEEEVLSEQPKNSVLEESIPLEPLSGEDSHKIEEYYSKSNKGKGVGKRTKGKENREKREREDDEESVNKKIKIN
ncbi:uncharacterized protein LOC142985466 [Anticarsia gemmatalis]|uniref:uncharacterized protein LOC142985466 n=1 Tax=Anticarsia gemmatalis TaxID=129554 RepID=UPI003F76EE39